jgi:hypothetical protein
MTPKHGKTPATSHLGILYTNSTPMTTTGTIPSLPLHGHAGERSSGPARISREEDQAGGTRETEEGEEFLLSSIDNGLMSWYCY